VTATAGIEEPALLPNVVDEDFLRNQRSAAANAAQAVSLSGRAESTKSPEMIAGLDYDVLARLRAGWIECGTHRDASLRGLLDSGLILGELHSMVRGAGSQWLS
jgi:hypothetical protein